MDLDSYGSRAASSLRHQVEPALDVEGARRVVARGAARRRSRRSVGASLAVASAVVVVVGALAALSLAVTSRDRFGLSVDDGRSGADMAVLGDLPRGPIDGRDSWRLPVVAKASTGLSDGERVRVYGKGFEPGEMVGVLMCAREAESEGVGGCMLGDESYVFAHVTASMAYEDGTVVQDFHVRRHITTPVTGPIDCASEAERCMVAVGASSNYDRSGGTYVDFAGAPPFPEPSFSLAPGGPYAPGQVVTATAEGLVPGRLNQVQQCAGEVCVPLARGFSAPDGTFAAEVTVNSVVYHEGEAIECAGGCTVQLTGVGPKNATSSPFPDPVAVAFGPGDPLPEGQVPPPVTPPPAGDPEVLPLPDPGATTAPSDPDVTASIPSTVPPSPPPSPSVPG